MTPGNSNEDERDTIDSISRSDTVAAVAPTQRRVVDTVPSDRTIDIGASSLDDAGYATRYEMRRVLGAGGMGEVRLCKDRRIGREVAVKVMRPLVGPDAEARARFVREARVQGQLEHPTVVPVYDLGLGPDGAVYFTMKRVRGMSLDAILEGLRRSDAEITARYSRRKLLTAFTSICLSLDFAHSRGVLHRDLKPANVMLGDFGEVHVLDWGIAKIVGVGDDPKGDAPAPLEAVGAQATSAGALMGTPGYMAPEQARGDVDRLDARSDVYSLGAILFELLTLHPLHEGSTVNKLLISTDRGAEARASVRYPDAGVPPELEAVCVRAVATAQADRFASAREMSDAVERYLDGDRDLAMRKQMAADHRAAAVRALESDGGGREARSEALREATRALALDPEDREAVGLLARLLIEPPGEVPPEAQRELERSAERARETAARVSAVRHLTWMAFAPLILLMGVRNWSVGSVVIVSMLASAAIAWWISRPTRATEASTTVLVVASSIAIGLLSTLVGPFVIVPGLAATNALFFALHSSRSLRRLVAVAGLLAVFAPAVLQLAGVIAPVYRFTDDRVMILPTLAHLPPHLTWFLLAATSAALIVTAAVLAGRVKDTLDAAERRLFLHAWQLRQLVPQDVRMSLSIERPMVAVK